MSTSIAVIGGGLTGLVAARELAKAGHRVTVFEAFAEVGGLAAGFPLHGTSLEKTYHHIFLTDTDIRSLVDELGIQDTLVWKDSSMGVYYGGAMYPFGTAGQLLGFKPLPFIDRIRLGLIALYLQKTKNWKRFIPVPAAQWMRKACGANAYRVMWEPLLQGKFHRYAQHVSMAWLWARIHTRANSKPNPLAKEQLGYFQGGFAVIVDALMSDLQKRGVVVKTSVPVQELRSSDTGCEVVLKSGDTQRFDKVIVTAPSGVFASLIEKQPQADAAYLQKLRSIDYLGAVCMVFTSSQSLSKFYWTNVNDLASPFLVFVQHTNLMPTQDYEGRQVYYIGTYVPHDHPYFTQTDAEITDEWFAGLKKVFPDFDRRAVEQIHLFRLKNAQHVVDCAYAQKIPDFRTPLPGIFLSNFSQIFPEDRGTNFAVRDGRKIASLVLSDLPNT